MTIEVSPSRIWRSGRICLSALAIGAIERICRIDMDFMTYILPAAPMVDNARILMARDNWTE